MTRPPAWLAALAAVLALLPTACGPGAPAARRPNVLLITLDTTRADRFAAYGQTGREITPHLDAFAREGVVFEQSFSNSSFTPPSHASILTGRYPSEHGLMHWSDALGPVATAAELFSAAGYRTLAASPLKTLFVVGLSRGFDSAEEFEHTQGDGLMYLADAPTINARVLPALTADDERPFFAWLHYYDAHRVFGRQGEEWAQRYGSHPDPSVGGTEAWYQLDPADRARLGITPAQADFIDDRYDGGLAYLDEQIGVLLDELRAAGVLDDTLVVITADHGEVLHEHDEEWYSHDPYLVEENIRVPLLVRLPGGEHAGTRVPDLVQGVDVLPTLLALTGVDAGGARFSGLDLSPTLEGRALRRDFVYAERRSRDREGQEGLGIEEVRAERDRRRMLRTATHKLIQAPDRGTTELFAVDDEHRDVSGSSPDVFHGLMGLYTRQLEALQPVDDTGEAGGLDPETEAMLRELGYLEGRDP